MSGSDGEVYTEYTAPTHGLVRQCRAATGKICTAQGAASPRFLGSYPGDQGVTAGARPLEWDSRVEWCPGAHDMRISVLLCCDIEVIFPRFLLVISQALIHVVLFLICKTGVTVAGQQIQAQAGYMEVPICALMWNLMCPVQHCPRGVNDLISTGLTTLRA